MTPADLELLNQAAIVARNMEIYGGSFAQNLGRALAHADFVNTRKIAMTWPDEWTHYLNFTTTGVKK